jgi:hypothetical protein
VIDLEKIAAIIPKTFQKLGLHHQFRSEMIFYRWDNLVGADIASHTRPLSINHGLLFVAVNNSVWSHHLSMMKEALIRKMNDFAQAKVITDIKFQAGSIQRTVDNDEEQPEISLAKKIRNIVLTPEEVVDIRHLIAPIQSKGLRERLFSLLVKDHKLTKYKQQENYHQCAKCSTLCPPTSEYCTICFIENRQENVDKICKLLIEAPWIHYEECKKFIACSVYEFKKAKQQLIVKLINKIEIDGSPPLVESTLVMLITSTKPEFLDKDLIERIISKVRRKKHVFASRQ